MYAAESGYEIILAAGVGKIRAKSIRQTSRLVELADQYGWQVKSPRDTARRGGMVAVNVPYAAAVVRELARRDILVDFRPGVGIRIAPHFYTADDEIDATMKAIHSILETKAYEPYLSAGCAQF